MLPYLRMRVNVFTLMRVGCVQAEAFGTTAAAGEVMRQLLAAGVPAHLGFELTGWTLDPQNGQVTSVQARREDGEKLALDVEASALCSS